MPTVDRFKNIRKYLPTVARAVRSRGGWNRFRSAGVLTAILVAVLAVSSAPRPAPTTTNKTSNPPAPAKPDASVLPEGRPYFRVYGSRDGLPQNSAMTAAFDKRGYLWIGTQDGAAYYNGRKWQVVNMPNRTVSNFVRKILPSEDGSMWFGTRGGGLVHYDSGVWTVYNQTNSPLRNTTVTALFETTTDSGKRRLIVGNEGTGLVCFEDGQWKPFETPNSELGAYRVLALLETKTDSGKRVLWATNGNGLFRYEDAAWTHFTTDNSELPNKAVTCLAEGVSQTGGKGLWIGTFGDGVAFFDGRTWTRFNTATSGLSSNEIESLHVVHSASGEETVWVGTSDAGMCRFSNGTWTVFNTSNSKLPHNSVVCITSRPDLHGGSLWIGMDGGGIARHEPGCWGTIDTENSGLLNKHIKCVLVTESEAGESGLWIGTFGGGLTRYEAGNWTTYTTENSGLPDNQVMCVLETLSETGKKGVWVGTYGGGLARFEAGKWTVYNSKSSEMTGNRVMCLLETMSDSGSKRLWVGTFGSGLFRCENGKWTRFMPNNSPLPHHIVYGLASIGSTVWAGTFGGGLAQLDHDRWTIFNSRNSGIPNDNLQSVQAVTLPGDRKSVWVGTSGGGVSRFDPVSNQWTTFSDSGDPPLPNNIVYQIRQGHDASVYLFTNKGVARLKPRSQAAGQMAEYDIRTYTTDDGLPSIECSEGASFVDRQGRVWAGTIEGLSVFHPKDSIAESAPLLYIERTFLSGSEYRTKEDRTSSPDRRSEHVFPMGESFHDTNLAHDENHIVFEYALLSYFNESETRYRTQLVGVDKEPSGWTTDFKREYPTLPNGKYQFRVWGRDSLGTVVGPVEISFSIRPAPWRTWWAYTAYFLIAVGCAYEGFRLRLKTLRRRNKMLEAKVEERTAELARAVKETEAKNVELERINEQIKLAKSEVEYKNAELDDKNRELDQRFRELAVKNKELVESQQRADRIFSALAEALPGTVLDDKYRLDEKIGAGGFGAVFRATHLALNRQVAVKVFRPNSGNDSPAAVERFRREGMTACRVNHPNAILVIDSGISTQGIAYLVMELLHGHSLAQELHQSGRLSLRRCVEILEPVAQVLEAAHAAGLIHRDIKPENIFLHRDGQGEVVKVVDFGIAKLVSEDLETGGENLTSSGMVIGTPTYTAPERLAGDAYDGKADIYSLGITVYEMLCGQVPFQVTSRGIVELIIKQVKQSPPPLSLYVPNIPPEVERIVLRSLSKNPADRPSAGQLALEFAAAATPHFDETLEGIPPEPVTDEQVDIATQTLGAISRVTTGMMSASKGTD